jgi:DNA-binding transcriptional ArsR family regulator
MVNIAYIAEAAALIGDPARANMLSALKDDGVLSAAQLANIAGVAPNTASGHLAKLTEAGMVTFEAKGRHRFYTLASPEVADTLEAIEALASDLTPRRAPRGRQDDAMLYARCCYDHLAGNVGVKLTDGLVKANFIERIEDGFIVPAEGKKAFASLGVDIDAIKTKPRRFIRSCSDWSEHKPHLGGALAANLFQRFCDLDWFRRKKGTRAVLVRPEGKAALRKHFGVDV